MSRPDPFPDGDVRYIDADGPPAGQRGHAIVYVVLAVVMTALTVVTCALLILRAIPR